MTRFTSLGYFWVSVAASARYRINPTINPVAGNIIPPVRHSPICVRLIFYGRFQLVPDTMAIVAETGFVAHVADLYLLNRHGSVVFHKHRRVHIPPIRHIFIGLIVTVHAVFEISAILFRVQRWWNPPFLGNSTGKNQPDHTAGQTYTKDNFFVHNRLPINTQTGPQS